MIDEDIFSKYLRITRDDAIHCNHTLYLDHAGTPIPAKSLLTSVYDELMQTSFANPHSTGGKLSVGTDHIVTESRTLLLNHLHLNAEEYDVIFTSGATASIKQVGDIFPWHNNGVYWLSQNAHTSILGLRKLADKWHMLDSDFFSHTTDQENLESEISAVLKTTIPHSSDDCDLLAVPGECNFSGCKLSFESIIRILKQMRGLGRKIMWLLDAAKLCGSSDVNLSLIPSEFRPQFICISCYKIFGYPTGIGALIIRRDIMPLMKKKYFGGGTLLSGAADIDFAVPRPMTSHEHFEDGTLNFHGIAAIRHGFKFIESLGGMKSIEEYTFQLWKYTILRMKELIHNINGTSLPLCIIYSQNDVETLSSFMQGPVITFNIQYANGEAVGFQYVNQLCSQHSIQIRTGCFCNIGGCQKALQFSGKENEENYKLGRVCSDHNEIDVVNNRNTGACRISFGFGSTKQDCDKFIEFLHKQFLHKFPSQILFQQLSSKLKITQRVNTNMTNSMVNCIENNMLEDLFWQQEIHSFPLISTKLFKENGDAGNIASPPPYAKNAALSAMFIYPIKSCAGVRVNNWPVTSQGLLFDRYFAIVTDSGKVINQKHYPQLALIYCSFELSPHPFKPQMLQLSLHIHSEYAESKLIVPLEEYYDSNALDASTNDNFDSTQRSGSNRSLYQVCGRPLYAEKVSHDADLWFTEFIAHTSQLLQANSDNDKISKKKFSFIRASTIPEDGVKSNPSLSGLSCNETIEKSKKEKEREAVSKTFVNTAQYLLLSVESIRALIELIRHSNEQQKNDQNVDKAMQVKAENFRPNLIVSGINSEHSLQPHGEDQWKELYIPLNAQFDEEAKRSTSYKRFQISGPCSRCSMVNVNGQRGIMDCRVFEALSEYRKHGSSVYFGQFLTFDADMRDGSYSHNPIIGIMSTGSVLQYTE